MSDASEVRSDVSEILRRILKYDGPVTTSLGKNNIDCWDSIRHLTLVASLEEHFSITISLDEMVEMTSVDAIQRVLSRYGV